MKADGELIFSKHAVGRFPEDSEVLEALTKRVGAGEKSKK